MVFTAARRYSSAVSRLRRPFLADRYFFITVRLLKAAPRLCYALDNMDAKNKLYFGDNVKILREYVPDASRVGESLSSSTSAVLVWEPAKSCRVSEKRNSSLPRL